MEFPRKIRLFQHSPLHTTSQKAENMTWVYFRLCKIGPLRTKQWVDFQLHKIGLLQAKQWVDSQPNKTWTHLRPDNEPTSDSTMSWLPTRQGIGPLRAKQWVDSRPMNETWTHLEPNNEPTSDPNNSELTPNSTKRSHPLRIDQIIWKPGHLSRNSPWMPVHLGNATSDLTLASLPKARLSDNGPLRI